MGSSLHDLDLVAWAQQSAILLREGAEISEEERLQLANELDDMAGNARRELKSRAISLAMHLLKVEYQPEKHSRSWHLTIENQRGELVDLLEQSPSLHGYLDRELPRIYQRARVLAEIETGLNSFPADNPFTLERLLRS